MLVRGFKKWVGIGRGGGLQTSKSTLARPKRLVGLADSVAGEDRYAVILVGGDYHAGIGEWRCHC
jgi:hypothetical protein